MEIACQDINTHVLTNQPEIGNAQSTFFSKAQSCKHFTSKYKKVPEITITTRKKVTFEIQQQHRNFTFISLFLVGLLKCVTEPVWVQVLYHRGVLLCYLLDTT